MGPRPDLGQGREDRLEDDQRTGRDPGREERVQVRVQAPALPHPGGRVLRVEKRSRQDEGAPLHSPEGRWRVLLRGAVGALEKSRRS